MKKVMVALMAVVLVSCGGVSTGLDLKSEKELVDGFQKLNSSFTKSFDEDGDKDALAASVDSLVLYFDSMIKNHPQDTNIANMYFAAGEASMKVNKGEEAIKYFDALATNYPKNENVSKGLYLKGQTYEVVLVDTAQAIAAYKYLYNIDHDNEWSKNAGNQVLHLINSDSE
jgi:outer membrane protein assembly factor BamD (BamD/ComL family)